jgi:hypothetical protein
LASSLVTLSAPRLDTQRSPLASKTSEWAAKGPAPRLYVPRTVPVGFGGDAGREGEGEGDAPVSEGGSGSNRAGDDGDEGPADGGREAGDDGDADRVDGPDDGDVPPGLGRTIVPKQPAVKAIAAPMAKMVPF